MQTLIETAHSNFLGDDYYNYMVVANANLARPEDNLLSVSNYRIIEEAFPNLTTIEKGGPYGIHSYLCIDKNDPQFEAVKKFIEPLNNYPVLDDEDLSDRECEIISEWWGELSESEIMRWLEDFLCCYPRNTVAANFIDLVNKKQDYDDPEWDADFTVNREAIQNFDLALYEEFEHYLRDHLVRY